MVLPAPQPVTALAAETSQRREKTRHNEVQKGDPGGQGLTPTGGTQLGECFSRGACHTEMSNKYFMNNGTNIPKRP